MLTVREISLLLDRLSEVPVVEPSLEFPYRVSERRPGYRDGEVGALQAKLSLLLAAARRAES